MDFWGELNDESKIERLKSKVPWNFSLGTLVHSYQSKKGGRKTAFFYLPCEGSIRTCTEFSHCSAAAIQVTQLYHRTGSGNSIGSTLRQSDSCH